MVIALSISEFASLAGAGAALVAAIGGVSAAWLGVREYRLKSAAQRVEIDVQLSKLLAELVPIANGRSGHLLSEASAEVMAKAKAEASPEEISEALEAAVITLPVGEVTQVAAIASLGYLGDRHIALREASRQALISLSFPPTASNLERSRKEALEKIEATRTV